MCVLEVLCVNQKSAHKQPVYPHPPPKSLVSDASLSATRHFRSLFLWPHLQAILDALCFFGVRVTFVLTEILRCALIPSAQSPAFIFRASA